MHDDFDACFEWLGIPPSEQPPNHYRLLGVPLFVDNPRVIENAADQRMAHLRTLQTGLHAAESQRLLNDVAAARICLLNPQKKAAYDEQLRQTLGENPEDLGAATSAARPDVASPTGGSWQDSLGSTSLPQRGYAPEPRVAAARQPWALGQNPVGIQSKKMHYGARP